MYDGSRYSCFRNLDDYLNAVCRPEYSGYRWFAHYGGKFDVGFLWDHLRSTKPGLFAPPTIGKRTLKIDVITAGSCVIALTLSEGKWVREGDRLKFKRDYYWRFTDSYRLAPGSLYDLTHTFDVEHKKLKFDSKSWQYNFNDCLGLYEVLDQFFDRFDVCSETIASHSMRVFRTHFMRGPILIPPEHAEEIARHSYTGGRCEVYRWDEAKVNKYDINSLYPWAMQYPVPVEYLTSSQRIPDNDDQIGFYDATVNYPDTYLPALPVRFDKLYFPVGKFRGHFTSMELRRAIDDGAAVTIHQGRIFRSEPILREYVEALYKMKLEAEQKGDGAGRFIAKILANSLYGKFGESRDKRQHTTDPGTTRLYGTPPKGMRAAQAEDLYGPELWPVDDTGMAFYFTKSRSLHILPSIASTVTSRARLRILDYLRGAGRIWYTDTDSMFTDSSVPVSSQLGEMKLEGAGRFQAYRLKEYRFDGHVAVKGLPTTKTLDTGEKVEDLTLANLYLSGAEVKIKRMAGFNESLNTNQPMVRQVEVRRRFRSPGQKRCRVGNDTRPWKVEEII